jgi:hypothetical protein
MTCGAKIVAAEGEYQAAVKLGQAADSDSLRRSIDRGLARFPRNAGG